MTRPILAVSSATFFANRPDIWKQEPWVKLLLQAYIFLDKSLENELARQSRPLACCSGCIACCRQPIPLTLPEILGIHFALKHGLAPVPGVKATPDQVLDWRCPFLFSSVCSIYAVRPFACRRFLVFATPCSMTEDPTLTRPKDVHRPSSQVLRHVLERTLPLYRLLGIAVTKREERTFFNRHTSLIQHIDWAGLPGVSDSLKNKLWI